MDENGPFTKGLPSLHHDQINQAADLFAALNQSAPIRSFKNLEADGQFLHEVGFLNLGKVGLISQSGTATAFDVEHTPNLHLVVVCGGSLALETAGGSLLLRQGEATLVPPGFRRSAGRHSLVSITLLPAEVARAAAAIAGPASATKIPEVFDMPHLKEGPMLGLIQSLLGSLDALLPLGEGMLGKLVMDDVLLRHAAVLLDPTLLTREPADLQRHHEPQGQAAFDELIDFIRANLDRPLRLSDLEARSQFSRWGLQEAFRQRLQATPMGWIREQRLQQAMEHLQHAEERLPLVELALRCGYLRLSHFSRDFKKRFGLSPSRVRRL